VNFLELNLPKAGKKKKVSLGVYDKVLATSIKAAFPSVDCETGDTSEVVQDMLRGIRLHATKLLKQLREGDLDTAQLGLVMPTPEPRSSFRSSAMIITSFKRLPS